jgi:predicted acylesterase/phospholipase RssA
MAADSYLQGGGALGAYEAGIFEALSDKLSKENIKRPLFDIIASTSVVQLKLHSL